MNNNNILNYDHAIYAVDCHYLRPQLAAVHLIVERGRVVVADTATHTGIPYILAAMQALELPLTGVDYIFLSHVHLDHAGGAGALMQLFPEARLIVHPRGVRHMADPTRLFASAQTVYGVEETFRLYGDPVPIDPARIIAAADGYSFDLAGRTMMCLDTPGHANHHLCLLDTRSNCLFTGDSFGMSYRELDVDSRAAVIPSISPTQFDPALMHDSVERILAHRPPALYLPHFGRVRDIPRLGSDLRRLIDAHLAAAECERDSGPDREERIHARLWRLMAEEANHQGWRVSDAEWQAVIAPHMKINAQGLEHWLSTQ